VARRLTHAVERFLLKLAPIESRVIGERTEDNLAVVREALREAREAGLTENTSAESAPIGKNICGLAEGGGADLERRLREAEDLADMRHRDRAAIIVQRDEALRKAVEWEAAVGAERQRADDLAARMREYETEKWIDLHEAERKRAERAEAQLVALRAVAEAAQEYFEAEDSYTVEEVEEGFSNPDLFDRFDKAEDALKAALAAARAAGALRESNE
jgi:hypothetical protein